jgi:hypothetical protein
LTNLFSFFTMKCGFCKLETTPSSLNLFLTTGTFRKEASETESAKTIASNCSICIVIIFCYQIEISSKKITKSQNTLENIPLQSYNQSMVDCYIFPASTMRLRFSFYTTRSTVSHLMLRLFRAPDSLQR